MGVNLTDHQLWVIKGIIEFAEAFANMAYRSIENHLDGVGGVRLQIDIDPDSKYCTKEIIFGNDIEHDAGYVRLTRGKEEARYAPTGRNSPEYEYLFADPEIAERMRKICKREKPLPPDGLWIGDPRNDHPVDSGEWDINDSLS